MIQPLVNTRKAILLFSLLCYCLSVVAQPGFFGRYQYSEADTLRGAMRPERSCYDVLFYDLNLEVIPEEHALKGYNQIHFEVLQPFTELQIDLFENLTIDSIVFQGQQLKYQRIHNAVFVQFPKQELGEIGAFSVHYHGKPIVAKMPPWDGGFVWNKDKNRNYWIAVTCEGIGASMWWPNKDHLSDEPDSMAVNITVPKPLKCIANGNLRREVPLTGNRTRFEWFISYPINNYNISINIGDYVHFSDIYVAEEGDSLSLDYYVLSFNEAIAKEHFAQVDSVLGAYEYYFGRYPFWEDGFALIETPYLGMEHQSGIAYGNKFMRGYLGGMIPEDMDWDYIIVHETGHEYFGNSVSCNDLAEMWLHESFTTYMEALYVEYTAGYEDAVRYMTYFREYPYINNRQPIIGPLNVNWDKWSGTDHYHKGSWMLHTLRHVINDDDCWFDILRTFYEQNQYGHVHSDDFIELVNTKTQKDFTGFFDQFLNYAKLPILEYEIEPAADYFVFRYRWNAEAPGFEMPVLAGKPGNYVRLHPSTSEWKETIVSDIHPDDFHLAKELMLFDVKMLKGG